MLRSRPRIALTVACLVGWTLLGSCGKIREQADSQFGDQHFKTVVSLVELYRVRHGVYPAVLGDLDFVGD